MTISFARHQFPPAIVRHAVWLYLRFTLSYRDVENLLAERGLDVSYETVRRWVSKFGPFPRTSSSTSTANGAVIEWTPLLTASQNVPRWLMFVASHATERASMKEASIIGLDLSKRSFRAHGALADGSVAFRKKLTREKVLGFLAEQPRCTVAMETCGSAHHWGRAIHDAGHEVRLIPPAYVKPFVKRQKNDAADAEAIAEAASR